MPGHVFVTRGDITRLACDAWLLPGNVDAGSSRPAVSATWLENSPKLARHFDGERLRNPKLAEGTARVWPIPPQRGGDPRRYLVHTGGHERKRPDWFVAALDEFLATVQRDRIGPRSTGRRVPLVAVPLIGTGKGGLRRRRGPMIRALLARLSEAAVSTAFEADYVLVTYQESDHAAAQSVRREMGGLQPWPDLNDELNATAERLAGEALAGRLVLFLGAGVSAGAGLPLWDDLLRKLGHVADIPPEKVEEIVGRLDPMDAAHILERRLADRGIAVGDAITRVLDTDRYSIGHTLLASLPVREVATTNYDELFEKASLAVSRPTAVLPYAPDPELDRWLLKLHGTLGRPEDIVLTRDDYLSYSEQRAALAGLVQGLLITKHMLFVGFSLGDENFHRIVHDVRKAVRPHEPGTGARIFGTAVLLDDDPLRRELWEADVNLISTSSDLDSERDDVASAARRLEIFLDRLLAETAVAGPHLLDPAYRDLLSESERKLRDDLNQFLKNARPSPGQAPAAWARIETLARELGHRGHRPRS